MDTHTLTLPTLPVALTPETFTSLPIPTATPFIAALALTPLTVAVAPPVTLATEVMAPVPVTPETATGAAPP